MTTQAQEAQRTGTREQWLAARLELLKAEKELTRHNDAVARMRQELPWVRLDKRPVLRLLAALGLPLHARA